MDYFFKKLKKPKYFMPVVVAYQQKSSISYDCKIVRNLSINTLVQEMFNKLKNYFKIEEEIIGPSIGFFDEKSANEISAFALYNRKSELVIINIKKMLNYDSEFVLYHELLHHLLNKINSMKKVLVLKNGYQYGKMLREGFVNYLIEQFLRRKKFGAYALATYVVRQLANILGADEIKRIVLQDDLLFLKNDFDNKLGKYYNDFENISLLNEQGNFLKMTPFEILCGAIEFIDDFKDEKLYNVILKMRVIKSVNEMLNYYAKLTKTTNFQKFNWEEKNFLGDL